VGFRFSHTGSFKNIRLRHVRSRTCHWNSSPPLEGASFQDIPMLDLLAFFQAIEVIESRGFAVKQAFAHENAVALSQNLVVGFGNVNEFA